METVKFTITKTQIECYKIRSGKGAWADITIDAQGNTGRIQIASDYGSWQYYWGACGERFKRFLADLDIYYAAGKFGEGNWFDLDKTIENLKSRIKEYSADYPEKKAELKSELKELKDSSCKEEFVAKMWQSPEILEMEGHNPEMITDVSPSFKKFWEVLWPVFIEELKKEN